MSKYPFSQLHLGNSSTVATAGPHVLVLNSENGSTVAKLDSPASTILFSCVDQEFKHLVTISEDKKLKVWETDGLNVLSERELPKKPTGIYLTEDDTTIIVSDKFGDVHSYPLHPTTEASAENPTGGTLVLGHVSLLTTFVMSRDEKYIITADRDEHIRVSWYPQGYNIEMFCLGHEKFVSALHIPPSNPSVLVSGGGDPVLKAWDWMSGSLKHEIKINETVEPFIAVKSKLRLWMEDDDGGARRRGTGRRARAKAKKAKKGKQPAEDVEMDQEAPHEPEDAENPPADEEDEDEQPFYRPAVETLVLAVSKIDSLDSNHIVFTVYGSTAIFWCNYASDNPSQEVQSLDLGKPVLNFIPSGDSIWVLLDGEWGNSPESNPDTVRVLTWNPDSQQLVESHQENPLLTSLNTLSMPASTEQIKALDLYGHLNSLPKVVDASRDPMKHDVEEKAELAAEGGVEMTSRELGRLRHKKALAAKTKTKAGTALAEGEEEHQGPDNKKVKSDDGDNGEDTTMDS